MAIQTEPACKVLLIDDDPAVCRDYARVLQRVNLAVETATNGWAALERVESGGFDAVLADLAMPGLDGMGVLRGIHERDPELPVLLMTGAPSLNSALKAVEYRAVQYLVKPVDPDTLAEAVWRAVDLHQTLKRRRPGPDAEHGHREALDRALDTALSTASMAYQPIVHATGQQVVAYQALVRSDAVLRSPAELFDAAERARRTHELGRTIRRKVAEDAEDAPPGALLFVNVRAAELNDNELLSSSAPLSRQAERVVLELTERSAMRKVDGLWTRLVRLRRLGFRIALDDLGEGYAGLSGLAQLLPDFAKLGTSLVRGIDRSPRKRSLVKGIARTCARDLGVQVVCEGVERREERDILVADGLDLLQGDFFAKPGAEFPVPGW
jgi:EAL domain-containing protein (putative c-di-GMP-specific phosphodiesterase class I)